MKDSIDALLSKHEHFERPGIPSGDFVLSRRKNDTVAALFHRASGKLVPTPPGIINNFIVSPNKRRIALEIAQPREEHGELYIVDLTKQDSPRRVSGVRLRYDTVAWTSDSDAVITVPHGSQNILRVDARSEAVTSIMTVEKLTAIPPSTLASRSVRLRAHTWGPEVAITATGADKVTRVYTLTAGRLIAQLPNATRVIFRGTGSRSQCIYLDRAEGLHRFDLVGQQMVHRWSRKLSSQSRHLTYSNDDIMVHLVGDDSSELVTFNDSGTAIHSTSLDPTNDVITVTGLGFDGDSFLARIEGPVTQPTVVKTSNINTTVPEFSWAKTRTVTITADDNVKIDVRITGTFDDVAKPMILSCYGGFGFVNAPTFEPSIPAWCEKGGYYATALVRGGGERGKSWHEQGRGVNKSRTVADLAVIARSLIERGFTSQQQLVLAGASHGGFVVASCALQHPTLFAGVVCTAALLDLHRLADNPLGTMWIDEFGDPNRQEIAEAMLAYSPLSLAESAQYGADLPKFLVVTMAHDTRVDPAQSVRFSDAVRRTGGTVFEHTISGAGHGSNPSDVVHNFASLVLNFAAKVTGAI